MKPQIITFYLPQFHRVKENDLWWGDGFTEWTAVRNAKPLFEGHYQPHSPLNDNYYDLLDRETMLWQAELMKQFGVYGQCIYHYYFKHGRKILERPAENLLKWKDIDMPFCFSWANESWVTSWSNIRGGNAWADIYESEEIRENKQGILLEQGYGTEKDWLDHFDYLLPFFEDCRYIKKDNKPIFHIYKPEDIYCLHEMVEVWNECAKTKGFDGIYFIGNSINPDGVLDAVLSIEPRESVDYFFHKKESDYSVLNIDGEELSKKIISKKDSVKYLCGVVGFDNSPRKAENSCIVTNLTPEIFYKQMLSVISLSAKNEKDFVFVNAWNEWGEGMYLEPDEKYGYEYLNALKKASDDYIYAPVCDQETIDADNDMLSKKIQKYKGYWILYDKWMELIEKGRCLEEYFIDYKFKKVALYGYGMFGRHVKKQLETTSVEVIYCIDKNHSIKDNDVSIYGIEEDIPVADVIVVCVTYDKLKIKKILKEKVNCPIVFIEQVIDYLLEKS